MEKEHSIRLELLQGEIDLHRCPVPEEPSSGLLDLIGVGIEEIKKNQTLLELTGWLNGSITADVF